MKSAETLVIELYGRVWSEGDQGALADLIGPRYTIHSDPGDAWEGRTLDHAQYIERVGYSRQAFPDLRFDLHDLVAAANRVAVRWSAVGTQLGPLAGVPASGRRLHFNGQTIYQLDDGRLCGHWQVIDRLGFIEQLR